MLKYFMTRNLAPLMWKKQQHIYYALLMFIAKITIPYNTKPIDSELNQLLTDYCNVQVFQLQLIIYSNKQRRWSANSQ